MFVRLFEIIKENQDTKIFVHWRLGDARTGMMIAQPTGWQPIIGRGAETHEFGYRVTI